MKTKFTPEPWIVRKWDGNNWPDKRISIGCAESKEALFISPRYADIESESVKANANLVAAAPDMYNLLNKILNADYSLEWSMGEIEELLAKARGEK